MNTKKATDYGQITGNLEWIRKIRTFFRRIDSNAHGSVGVDDFLDISQRVLSAFPKIDSFYNDQVVQAVVNLWYGAICQVGEQHTRTTAQLKESKFIECMQVALNGKMREEFDSYLVTPFFDAADADHDGFLTQQEFQAVIGGWRGSEKDADLLFKLSESKEQKGKLSKANFHCILADFFFAEECKSKAARLWGPLINYKRPEDYPLCECGPVWEGKMRTMFRRMDINQAGKLRCHDFIQIGRSIAQRNHLDRRRLDVLLRSMLNIWVKFIAVDKDGNHFAETNEKAFIGNLRSMVNGEFRHDIDRFGWTFFKAVEVEGTGFISLAEYRNLQEAWHVGRDEAEGMFKVLDTDKDGKISSDEYMSAWVEYFLGEDPQSIYKTFFGPVIFKPAQGQ